MQSDRALVTRNRRGVAEELCVLYFEAVRSAIATETRGNASRGLKSRTLDQVDKSSRRAFLVTADACIELAADAREYVVAQFSKWRDASAFHRKFMIPSPQHMGTLAARVRYLQHQATAQMRQGRVAHPDEAGDVKRRFFVEERKLKGLARSQRRPPEDVLAEQPEQFSRDFLKHKKVWSVVGDLWDERQQS